jgi:hypothetical protein
LTPQIQLFTDRQIRKKQFYSAQIRGCFNEMRELGVKATLAVFALIGGSLVIVGCKTSKTTASSQARETIPDKRLAANARTIVSNWNHTLPNSGQKIDQRAVNHTLLGFKQMDLGDFPGAVASWDKAISIYSNVALLYDLQQFDGVRSQHLTFAF